MKAIINRSQTIGEDHVDSGTEVKIIKKAKNISEIEYKKNRHFIFTEDLIWN